MIVDTDVFVCDLGLLPRDGARTQVSSEFLSTVGDLWTTIVNVLEATGVVSHQLPPAERWAFFADFCTSFHVQVIYPPLSPGLSDGEQWDWFASGVATVIARGIGFCDAAMVYCAELEAADAIVTWNTKHFKTRTLIPVYTPEDYLKRVG